ncbi:MAG: hypothetical protein VX346_22040 [Planctomycetota bacterium]|nr:hypothetical protein [Planctomycetota bacterium]
MRSLLGCLLVLGVAGCGTGSSLSDEQILTVLELRLGQWVFNFRGGPSGATPTTQEGLSVGRWTEQGHAIEVVGQKRSSTETIPYHMTRTFNRNRGVFVDRVQIRGRTLTRHCWWNPQTRILTIQAIEPALPTDHKMDHQLVFDAALASVKGQSRVDHDGTEVDSWSWTGKKTGPIDNVQFEKLFAAFEKRKSSVVDTKQ